MKLYHLTPWSSNKKTGPMPVSTSPKTDCPPDCAMRAECYADDGKLAIHWRAVSNGERGDPWPVFVSKIAALPPDELWRHNQGGDLPRKGKTIDPVALGQLVRANLGKRGFTYTHHRDPKSLRWVREANRWGFTINLSANDLADADRLADTGAGPVVCMVPSHQLENTTTPKGRRVVICPNKTHGITCRQCQLCQRQRDTIIGFPADGNKKRIINIRLEATQ